MFLVLDKMNIVLSVISSVPDSVFIKFADGRKKLFSKFGRFGNIIWNPLTLRPIDLRYVSVNGQSISVDWNLCDQKSDFLKE